jgi:hypothetical protein
MGRQNESTNCGEEVCPKTAKTSLIDVSLAYSIGKSVWFWGLQECRRGFSGKNPIPTFSLDVERRS